MKITVTIPDDLGNEVMARTDDVSAFVSEALAEKLKRMQQQEAREKILSLAGSEVFSADALDILKEERRSSGRV